MVSRLNRINIVILMFIGMFSSLTYAFEYVKTATAEYGMCCGCNTIIYEKHFEGTEPTTGDGGDFSPNATRDGGTTEADRYGGTLENMLITTTDGAYSVLTINPSIFTCRNTDGRAGRSLAGKVIRLTGYYKTAIQKQFEVSGEIKYGSRYSTLDDDRINRTLTSVFLPGLPFWKKFDFYFDCSDLDNRVSSVFGMKLKVKSPDATTALRIDEISLCIFSDGTPQIEGPLLLTLGTTTGKWNKLFVPSVKSGYEISVPYGTPTIGISATSSGKNSSHQVVPHTLTINGVSASLGGAVNTLSLPQGEIAPVYITLKENNCEQSTYVLNFISDESRPVARIIRVNNSLGVDGVAHDGSTWAKAKRSIQAAFDYAKLLNPTAANPVTIWVAAGTYKPTNLTDPADPRSATFQLIPYVNIYGGFKGNETALPERVVGGGHIFANQTRLSGDLGTVGDIADNVRHVVTGANNSILDGLIIENGNTGLLMGGDYSCGAGLYNYYCSPVVQNCEFYNNSAFSGGAIYNTHSNAEITNCIFIGNTAIHLAGAIYDVFGTSRVSRSSFGRNYANSGGGMCIAVGAALITNCVFEDIAADMGGAIYLNGVTDGKIINSTFASSLNGTGNKFGVSIIAQYSDAVQIVNSIFKNNSNISDIYIQSSPSDIHSNCFTSATSMANLGTNNFVADPEFIDAIGSWGVDNIPHTIDDGFALQNISPCINNSASDNSAVSSILTDIAGNARIIGGQVDMGAYEFTGTPVDPAPTVTISSPAATGSTYPTTASTINLAGTASDNRSVVSVSYSKSMNGAITGSGTATGTNSWRIDNLALTFGTTVIEVMATDNAGNVGRATLIVTYANPETGIRYVRANIGDAGALGTPAVPGAVGAGCSWNSAYKYLQDALKDAADHSSVVTEIRVAYGTYYPDEGAGQINNSKESTFLIPQNTTLKGGYPANGGETRNLNLRTNFTYLSGDVDRNDVFMGPSKPENANHVVTFGLGKLLDGFYVIHGYASQTDKIGGGIFLNTFSGLPTIKNCIIRNNFAQYGGGGVGEIYGTGVVIDNCIIENNGTASASADGVMAGGALFINSELKLSNSTFTSNESDLGGAIYCIYGQITNTTFNYNSAKETGSYPGGGGGAIYCFLDQGYKIDIINCTFRFNTTTGQGGGAIAMRYDYINIVPALRPQIINSVFTANQSSKGTGGAAYFKDVSPDIINSTFNGNGANVSGGAVCFYYSITQTTNQPQIVNSIFWDDEASDVSNFRMELNSLRCVPVVSYSCIKSQSQAIYEGVNNICSAPLFTLSLFLNSGSPCIDAGNNNAFPTNIFNDCAGNPRKTDDILVVDEGNGTPPIIDMGAFEKQ